MSGTGHVETVGVGPADETVQQGVDHRQTRARPPVPEQPGFDVFGAQRLTQKRVVLQVDLRDRQIVGGRPPPQVQVELGIGIVPVGVLRPDLPSIGHSRPLPGSSRASTSSRH